MAAWAPVVGEDQTTFTEDEGEDAADAVEEALFAVEEEERRLKARLE